MTPYQFQPGTRLRPKMRFLDPSDLILMVKRMPGRLLLGPVWGSLIFKKGPKWARNHYSWIAHQMDIETMLVFLLSRFDFKSETSFGFPSPNYTGQST